MLKKCINMPKQKAWDTSGLFWF